MRNLSKLKQNRNVEEMRKLVGSFTIFEKIEFSGITRDAIRSKLADLRNRQVPQRTVLTSSTDADVELYWFSNWLHPQLKHWVNRPPRCQQGCSKKVRQADADLAALRFYENGQQGYHYTLADVYNYIGASDG